MCIHSQMWSPSLGGFLIMSSSHLLLFYGVDLLPVGFIQMEGLGSRGGAELGGKSVCVCDVGGGGGGEGECPDYISPSPTLSPF